MQRTPLTAEGIAGGLEGARRNGKGWMACCPAHDDHNPSLSLTDGEGGVLVHCHAGCSQESVIAALRWRGLWPKPESEPPRKTTYTYQHADGTPAFHVHRTDYPGGRKKIVQQLPDGQWKAPPAPRPLFNLPDILSNPEKPVLVVEGEKTAKAATVKFPEYVVTTSAGGSNAATQSDWSVLKDREVLIWPDNDPPGHKYAEGVKRLCEDVDAAKVSLFAYPKDVTFPTGWDLADPIPEGWKPPTAEEMIPAVPEPTTQAQRGFKRISWAKFKYQKTERIEWVVGELLRRGGVSIFVAPSKTGKSKTARNITRAVLLGLDCFGRATTPGSVIYMALDEGDVPPREHFQQMGLPDDVPLEMVIDREPEDALRKLAEMIEDVQPVLVVVDLMSQLIPISKLNDYGRVQQALQPLLDITRKCSAHVMLLHHARKVGGSFGAEVLGSEALAGSVDTILSLKRGEHYRSISSTQRTGTPLEDLVLRLDEETGIIDVAGTRAEVETERIGQEVLAFLKGQEAPVEMAIIQEALNVNRKRLSDALKALYDDGKIGRSGTGKKGNPYRYFVGENAVPTTAGNGEDSERCREQNLPNNSNGIDLEKILFRHSQHI